MTALKAAQNNDDIILRFVNYANEQRNLTIYRSEWIDNLTLSNVIEESIKPLNEACGMWKISVKPAEILTLKITVNKFKS